MKQDHRQERVERRQRVLAEFEQGMKEARRKGQPDVVLYLEEAVHRLRQKLAAEVRP